MTIGFRNMDILGELDKSNFCGSVGSDHLIGMGSRVNGRTSLVGQWLRVHLPMQGTRVQALVQEDPTCHGATKPVCHNY